MHAFIQSSLFQSLKSPGGGPPALFTRISGLGQSSISLICCSLEVISAQNSITFTSYFSLNSLAVEDKTSSFLPLITKSTPSEASASAHPLPNPLLEAQTIAFFPLIPMSILIFLLIFFII